MADENDKIDPNSEIEKMLPKDKLERDRIVLAFLRAVLGNKRG